TIGENNNFEGANEPKQLVYINFDGGFSDEVSGAVNIAPFSPTDFGESGLEPFTDTLINGGNIGGDITGIVPVVLEAFTNTPENHPLGQINVQLIDDVSGFAGFTGATDGLFLTTIDPRTAGLDVFTEIFVGLTDFVGIAPYGSAGEVDFANLNKSNQVIVFAETFAGLGDGSLNQRAEQFSKAFGNVIAHELGHALGLNHTGDFAPVNNRLYFDAEDIFDNTFRHPFADDIDNDPFTPDESNTGISLIGSGPTSSPDDLTATIWELGTARISPFEFPVGDEDALDLLLRWLT
ncbi:MAG: M66 family metalloprotease, partial [Planctomycetota bacterium]